MKLKQLLEMDLWDLHDDPTQVDGHEHRLHAVPEFAFAQLESGKLNKKDIKIAEKTISKNTPISFNYAFLILKKRFPAGEAAISKNGWSSFLYAFHVLKKRFPAGEAAILADKKALDSYRRWLGGRGIKKFYINGETIDVRTGDHSTQ